MKMGKSLIRGSAAVLLAMSGAQAADLPVKAKAVEYVRICSLYGAGFFYIPGTDTCIKLGGYLRVDTTFNGSPYDEPACRTDTGQQNRYRDYFASRSRMALTVDTRTATEYGVVRTFGQLDWSSAAPSGTEREVGTASFGNQVNVEFLFLQFAGFTFGRSASAYATPWHGYPGNNTSFLVGGHDTVTGTNHIQYTAHVGNIRVDQAWGLFQISGALHEVNGSYNALSNTLTTAATGPGGIAGLVTPFTSGT